MKKTTEEYAEKVRTFVRKVQTAADKISKTCTDWQADWDGYDLPEFAFYVEGEIEAIKKVLDEAWTLEDEWSA